MLQEIGSAVASLGYVFLGVIALIGVMVIAGALVEGSTYLHGIRLFKDTNDDKEENGAPQTLPLPNPEGEVIIEAIVEVVKEPFDAYKKLIADGMSLYGKR
jgi:hypothetical protein